MLAKMQMQETQDLKLQGFTKADIIRYYERQGTKPPSCPTINKYYRYGCFPSVRNRKIGIGSIPLCFAVMAAHGRIKKSPDSCRQDCRNRAFFCFFTQIG